MGCTDSGTKWRIVLYFLMTVGGLLNCASLLSCNFVSYHTPDGFGQSDSSLSTATSNEQQQQFPIVDLGPPFYQNTSATVGLFRYDVPNDGATCGFYGMHPRDNFGVLRLQFANDAFYIAATTGGISAVSLLIVCLVFATVEFVCFQYTCSRFFISFFFIIASICQGATFFMIFVPNLCGNGRGCTIETGGFLSIAAAGVYFVSGLLTCATETPTPLIRRLRASVNADECCCFCCCGDKSKRIRNTEEHSHQDQQQQHPSHSSGAHSQQPLHHGGGSGTGKHRYSLVDASADIEQQSRVPSKHLESVPEHSVGPSHFAKDTNASHNSASHYFELEKAVAAGAAIAEQSNKGDSSVLSTIIIEESDKEGSATIPHGGGGGASTLDGDYGSLTGTGPGTSSSGGGDVGVSMATGVIKTGGAKGALSHVSITSQEV